MKIIFLVWVKKLQPSWVRMDKRMTSTINFISNSFQNILNHELGMKVMVDGDVVQG